MESRETQRRPGRGLWARACGGRRAGACAGGRRRPRRAWGARRAAGQSGAGRRRRGAVCPVPGLSRQEAALLQLRGAGMGHAPVALAPAGRPPWKVPGKVARPSCSPVHECERVCAHGSVPRDENVCPTVFTSSFHESEPTGVFPVPTRPVGACRFNTLQVGSQSRPVGLMLIASWVGAALLGRETGGDDACSLQQRGVLGRPRVSPAHSCWSAGLRSCTRGAGAVPVGSEREFTVSGV